MSVSAPACRRISVPAEDSANAGAILFVCDLKMLARERSSRVFNVAKPVRSYVVSVSCILAFVSCRPSAIADYNCTDVGIPGLIIAVQDSINSAQSIFSNVTAVAIDGSFRDSTTYPLVDNGMSRREIAMVVSRPGRFSVTVTADGYAAWQKTNVVVSLDGGRCPNNVVPVKLIARLKRA